MSDERKNSFANLKNVRYGSEFGTVNCEKICLADTDRDGRPDIVIARSSSSEDSYLGEIAVYDLDLDLKACDNWDGAAMDAAVADIDQDGNIEILVAGGIKNSAPIIRVYRYNENYKGSMELSSQTSWKVPEGLSGIAKAVHVADMDSDGKVEIAVLTVVEGNQRNPGYAQLRLYDSDMHLRKITRWTPVGGSIVKWGHCMTAADIDGDGNDELIVLINFRHEGRQKSDLRAFDHHLLLKKKCSTIADETLFATCMSAGDVDSDGNTEIVLAGGIFSDVWQGATNQLMVFDGGLDLKTRVTWKTFRHSWVWDLQIDDVDSDGSQEIITYGGTSMRGRSQEDANIMGEIRIWDGAGLSTRDMFIWQSKPGEDTRPSRGCAMRVNSETVFVISTSRWSRRWRGPDLEMRTLSYKPLPGDLAAYSDLIKTYDEKDFENLKAFMSAGELAFTPLAMEALAVIGGAEASKTVGVMLVTQDHPLFLRTVELLRDMETEGIDELHGIGFTLPDDWIIVSPFDNTDNTGFNKQYPPEMDIDLNAFYAGKDRIVRWGKLDYCRRDAYIDLAYAHFESFERTGIEFNWNILRTETIAYALTCIHSPACLEAQLRLGSADGVKVWFNDELKHSANMTGNAAPDRIILPVSLAEGKNRILIKIANYKTNGWGFYFRVTDAEGRPVPNLRYERPEVSYVHNQMIACEHLLSLLGVQSENLRYLAAAQLASIKDKRGNEALYHLLQAEDESIRARSALALTLAADKRGAEPLLRYAPGQDHLFQLAAGYALRRIDDVRADRFSYKTFMELKVTNRENGFRVSPLFKGEETSHVDVGTERRFHLGDNISARYATIASFGIRNPRYRGMGLGSIAIGKACDLMAEMGHSCGTVSTGTNLVAHRLYRQNGYVDRRFPWEYRKQLKGGDVSEDHTKIETRQYTDDDQADVNRLRDQYNRNTVGPADWLPRGNFGAWIRIAQCEGKIIGYADVHIDPFEPVASINHLHVDADFQDEPSAAKALLLNAQGYAQAEGKKTISFRDPPVRYRDIMMGIGYHIEPACIRYGWVNMFKVIDLAAFLSEISRLLALRLQRSPHAGWCGSIGLKGSRLKATLEINRDGGVSVESDASGNADILIVTDDAAITNLVSGNEDIWDSYKQHTLTVMPIFNERIRMLIESLFPIMPHKQGGWW